MSYHPKTNDPKLQAYLEKAAIHDHRSEHLFRRILHILERTIAAITLFALVGAMGVEI